MKVCESGRRESKPWIYGNVLRWALGVVPVMELGSKVDLTWFEDPYLFKDP